MIENNKQKEKWNTKEIISIIIAISLAIAGIVTNVILSNLKKDPEPKTINSCFYKCEVSDATIYMGKIKNVEEGHIEDLRLSGVLNSEIIDFTTDSDNEATISYNKPRVSVLLRIPRMTFGNEYNFNIITFKNSDIKKPFIISWGHKGMTSLKLQPCDEKIKMGLDMGSKLSKLSHKARQTVIDRNDN